MPSIKKLLTLVPGTLAATLQLRQSNSNTASVNLKVSTGAPQHLASGFIYGIPDVPTQIPDHFYSDIGFNYARVGGAQLAAGGWVTGKAGYQARFQNTKSNYFQARKFGAKVILLPHDIFGTDHANSTTVWPGDNGDWTDYDNFLNTLISDLKSNNMLSGLVWDIWNEPDGSFWARSQAQYLDMYSRTHKRLRSDTSLNNVQISGPSYAGTPNSNNNWWTNWFARIIKDNVIPDQYSWHDEPGDVTVDNSNFQALLKQYKAPSRQVNINEYATFDQQISAGAAWWISRLERLNWIGLRGNWLSNCQLRDFMASLLTKTNTNDCSGTGYAPNGEFQVYQYYYKNMTGQRLSTSQTTDGAMDVYATLGSDKFRVLTGVLGQGTWYLTLNGLSAAGLPTSGTLNIQTWGFDDRGHFGEVDGPSNRGIYGHQYSGDTVTFPIYQTSQDKSTAWAFEFNVVH